MLVMGRRKLDGVYLRIRIYLIIVLLVALCLEFYFTPGFDGENSTDLARATSAPSDEMSALRLAFGAAQSATPGAAPGEAPGAVPSAAPGTAAGAAPGSAPDAPPDAALQRTRPDQTQNLQRSGRRRTRSAPEAPGSSTKP